MGTGAGKLKLEQFGAHLRIPKVGAGRGQDIFLGRQERG